MSAPPAAPPPAEGRTQADEDAEDAFFEKIAAAARGSGGKAEYTYADFEKMINSTPLFMRETPEQITEENSYVLEGLRSLQMEGDGDEVPLNFKNHGNTLYAQKSYKDAIKAYTDGIESGPKEMSLRVMLFNNRAAAHLALKNYRSALKDTSAVIALHAANTDPAKRDPPAKALYRAGQALIGLEKWDEAQDAIDRGRNLPNEADSKWWPALEEEFKKGRAAAEERKERLRRKTEMEEARKRAVAAHGLIVLDTPNPPDNPHPLDFDPQYITDVPLAPPEKAAEWEPPLPHVPLIFPVVLLYPQHHTSDLITHFHEDTTFEQQLEPIFPATPTSTSPPWSDWDTKHEYYTANLVVYAETAQQRLLKIGKEITLREVITKARRNPSDGKPRDGIPLRDGLLSFIVLVRGKEEREWIDNFKEVRDGK